MRSAADKRRLDSRSPRAAKRTQPGERGGRTFGSYPGEWLWPAEGGAPYNPGWRTSRQPAWRSPTASCARIRGRCGSGKWSLCVSCRLPKFWWAARNLVPAKLFMRPDTSSRRFVRERLLRNLGCNSVAMVAAVHSSVDRIPGQTVQILEVTRKKPVSIYW